MILFLLVYYSGSPLSVAVHRVGETLLIDEFTAPMAPPTGVSVARPAAAVGWDWIADSLAATITARSHPPWTSCLKAIICCNW